jgi:hypothetical protein
MGQEAKNQEKRRKRKEKEKEQKRNTWKENSHTIVYRR